LQSATCAPPTNAAITNANTSRTDPAATITNAAITTIPNTTTAVSDTTSDTYPAVASANLTTTIPRD
jgi:hypothetical protein